MKTVSVRVPDETAASLKRVAAMNGITPAEQMQRAWDWWKNEHRDELIADLGAVIESLRGGDDTEITNRQED